MIFYDQLQRPLIFKQVPQRIVSLVPSLTELLVDLGLKDKLVGVTKFCVHPQSIRKEKIVVGGTKEVHFDKIKSLQPDLVICNKEENTLEIVAELEKFTQVHISEVISLHDCLQLIGLYGSLFKVETKSTRITQQLNSKSNDFKSYIAQRPLKKVAYFIWRNPYMVAANHTFINHTLELNGFENVFANRERYPEVELEAIPELDYILLSSEPYPFSSKHIPEFEKYISKAKIKIVDGEYFSWYGTRLLAAFDYYKKLHENEIAN